MAVAGLMGGRDLDLTEHAIRGCLGARGARRDVLSGDDDRDLGALGFGRAG
jgi:hypothetical protein